MSSLLCVDCWEKNTSITVNTLRRAHLGSMSRHHSICTSSLKCSLKRENLRAGCKVGRDIEEDERKPGSTGDSHNGASDLPRVVGVICALFLHRPYKPQGPQEPCVQASYSSQAVRRQILTTHCWALHCETYFPRDSSKYMGIRCWPQLRDY